MMNFLQKLLNLPRPDFNLNIDYEPLEEQRRDAMRMYPVANGLVELQPDCDELPGAYGEFGTSLTNPIPVNGPIGEIVYLNMLRWKNKIGFFYHRLPSVDSPISNQKIDAFEVVTVDGSFWSVLYFAMYHPRRSRKSPLNMISMSWSKMETQIKMGIKYTLFGHASFVDSFPYGLPDAVASDETIKDLIPSGGDVFAKRISSMILENEGKWIRPDAHRVLVEAIRPLSIRVEQNIDYGRSSKGHVEFDSDDKATLVVNEKSDISTPIFMLGTIIRRELSPEDQIVAGHWVGAAFGGDGQPIWDSNAEKKFAEAFVTYTRSRTQNSSLLKDIDEVVPVNIVPLSPEMVEMLERYLPPGAW